VRQARGSACAWIARHGRRAGANRKFCRRRRPASRQQPGAAEQEEADGGGPQSAASGGIKSVPVTGPKRAALRARPTTPLPSASNRRLETRPNSLSWPPDHDSGLTVGHLDAGRRLRQTFDSRQRAFHVDAITRTPSTRACRTGRLSVAAMALSMVVIEATSTHGSSGPRLLTKSASDSPP